MATVINRGMTGSKVDVSIPRSKPASPARSSSTVTPSDTATISPIRQLYAGGAGTVSYIDKDGRSRSATVAAGQTINVNGARRVNAAGTTATGLLGIV